MLRKRPILVLFATLFILSGIGILLWTSNSNTEPPFLKNAQPNGYHEVARASSLLSGDPPPVSETNAAELAAIVQTNRAALDALRAALKLNIEAPAEAYEQTTIDKYLETAARIKRLAQTLKYEGRLAELQDRHSQAAAIYLELMQFGQKMQPGPLISSLLGLAIEELGRISLEKLEPKITGPSRSRIAADLENLNNSRLPFDETMRRERYFMRRNSPSPLHYFFATYTSRAAWPRHRSKYDRVHQSTAHLIQKFRETTAER